MDLIPSIIEDCITEPKMIDLYIKLSRNNRYIIKDNKHNMIIIKPNNNHIILCIILKIFTFFY